MQGVSSFLNAQKIDLPPDRRFIGLRQKMDFDGANYTVHCIYIKEGTEIFYLKISPDDGTNFQITLSEGADGAFEASQAVFHGSTSYEIGEDSTLFGYESYWVGTL